jgi:outer membrane murein-binding lipoprotein Lpp
MSRRAIWAALRRGWLVLVAAAAFGCAYQLVRSGSINQAKVSKIESGLEKVRELSFIKPVPLLVENRAEADRDIRAQVTHEISDKEFRLDGETGALIGLYQPGIELKQQTLKLLDSQVAGFYDPDTKRMILVSGVSADGVWEGTAQFLMQRDLMGEMVLAHELTHALQDQHFDLASKLDALKDNDDKALALKSVAEGDATITGFAYVVGGMNQARLDALVSQLSGLPEMFAQEAKSAPEGLRDPLIFQYSAGVKFVAEAYDRGGYGAVDDLFRHPPQSSQQILHPELYFDRPTPPAEITVTGYQAALGGWTKADQNCEGELGLNIILKQAFGADSRQVALAAAWKGDRILSLARGSDLSVIWLIELSSERAASQFATAYTEALDRRLALQTPHRVDYQSTLVLVVIGEAARHFAQFENSVFKQSRVTLAPPPRPALAPARLRAQVPAPPA